MNQLCTLSEYILIDKQDTVTVCRKQPREMYEMFVVNLDLNGIDKCFLSILKLSNEADNTVPSK